MGVAVGDHFHGMAVSVALYLLGGVCEVVLSQTNILATLLHKTRAAAVHQLMDLLLRVLSWLQRRAERMCTSVTSEESSYVMMSNLS